MKSQQPYIDTTSSDAKETLLEPFKNDCEALDKPTQIASSKHTPSTSSTSTGYPAPHDASSDRPRLLHIYHKGWYHRQITIMDSDKTTPLYTVDSNSAGLFSSKPHMKIYNASTKSLIGTATFHQMSRSIDLEIHGRSVLFKGSGLVGYTHAFRSPSRGDEFSWKRDGLFSGGDLKCLDERNQMCANFECSMWAMKKDGKLELAPAVQGWFMDELIVTGLAEVEYQRRKQSNGGGGAGGGGYGA